MLKNDDCLALPLLLSDGSGIYWTKENGYVRNIEYITANCGVYPVFKRDGEHWVTINVPSDRQKKGTYSSYYLSYDKSE